jgi:hypothetical protein
MMFSGFRVAVQHAAGMREGDGVADLAKHFEHPFQCGALGAIAHGGEHVLERPAADELHRIKAAPRDIRAEVMDGDDVGMIELRKDAGLAQEAILVLGTNALRGSDLHRNVASKAFLPRSMDRAHSAGADDLQDLVPGDRHGAVALQVELLPLAQRFRIKTARGTGLRPVWVGQRRTATFANGNAVGHGLDGAQ